MLSMRISDCCKSFMLPHLRPHSPPGDPEAPKVSRRSPATSASPPHACRRYRKRFSLPLVAVTDSSTMRGPIVTLHGVLREVMELVSLKHDIRAYILSFCNKRMSYIRHRHTVLGK